MLTPLVDLPIQPFFDRTALENEAVLQQYDRASLLAFAELHELPVRSYESRIKIIAHLAVNLAGTGVYQRIAHGKREGGK